MRSGDRRRFGEACIQRLAESLPTLVLLDINLATPTIGWDWLVQLRGASQTRELPILVVSMLDEPHQAAELGATAFLRKPCSPVALMAQVHQVLARNA